ncbi:MAG: hypothetical protein J6T35_07145, partial [Bacteroidales bacterium]|nr:hypothetical protein [Bacteroidales bacterium]
MKKNVLILIGTALLLALCCNKIPDSLRSDRYIPEDTTPTENAPIVEGDWRIDTIVPGAVWKKFAGRDREITQVNQIVNVMEIDLTQPGFNVKFHYGLKDGGDGIAATDQAFSNKRV